ESGTRFTFPREGDQQVGKIPADIIFVVRDKPHELFKRNGPHLEHTIQLSQDQLINGTGRFYIPTLEKLNKPIQLEGLIRNNTVKRIKNCGLPFVDDPEKRGDILVRFE